MEMDFGPDWCWSSFRGLFFTFWVHIVRLRVLRDNKTSKRRNKERKSGGIKDINNRGLKLIKEFGSITIAILFKINITNQDIYIYYHIIHLIFFLMHMLISQHFCLCIQYTYSHPLFFFLFYKKK
jgi:hypothetical protein